MTPTEALTVAADMLVRLSDGATPEPVSARVDALLALAGWLYDDASDDQGGTGTGGDPDRLAPAPRAGVLSGATYGVRCMLDGGDRLTVRGGPGGRLGPVVRVEASTASGAGDTIRLVLSPADARRLAAGFLDAADDADGLIAPKNS